MVNTKRNNYDYYDTEYLGPPKKGGKQKKRKVLNDMELFPSKFKAQSSTLEPYCRTGGLKGSKKQSLQRRSLLNRSMQNLCSCSVINTVSRCATPLGRSRKPFYDSTNIDSLKIPESDRRILELLALKKEQERESEELAHQAQLLWERSQNQRLKAENEQKLKWQKYVKEKRKSESMINLFRMEEIKQSLRESQKTLEESLRKRDENLERIKQKSEEKKKKELKEKQVQESLKKAIIDANYKHKEDEIEEFFQRHIEEIEEKLNKAESLRRQRQKQTHRRVASANRSEDLRHQENMLELMYEQSHQQQQKQRHCRERESRARERFLHYRQKRERSIKKLRAEQEERAAQVREMHRELTRGLEAWQDQVLLLQWADHQRAEAAVLSQREHRRLKVEVENKERQMMHELRFKRVKEQKLVKELSARESIIAKDERIQLIQRQRERELNEGRAQAQLTAELREHLRRTLSPETFDRKVARAALESRMSSRPISASPSIMSSHIRLG